MKTTYDVFEIAEQDLIIRGPGDFFSSNTDVNLRQSGGFEFKLASMCDSSDVMERAFSSAKALIHSDPELTAHENSALRELCYSIIKSNTSTIS